MVAAGGPDNSISFVYLTPAFITDISQGIAKAIKIDDRAEAENGSSGCEPPQFSSHDLLSVRFSSRHSCQILTLSDGTSVGRLLLLT